GEGMAGGTAGQPPGAHVRVRVRHMRRTRSEQVTLLVRSRSKVNVLEEKTMSRSTRVTYGAAAAVCLAIIGGVTVGLCRGQQASNSAEDRLGGRERQRGMHKVRHIVFIVKENRTFDNYFGTFPGADGATTGTLHTGEVIPLGPAPDVTPHDINHSYQAAVTSIDGGAMDGFDLISGGKGLLGDTQDTEDEMPNYFS